MNAPECKVLIVTPIIKSALPNKIQNYGPIVILPTLSFALEDILSKFLMNKLIMRFNSTQHGFEPKKSLVTQTISSIAEVLAAVGSGSVTAAAYFDLVKPLTPFTTLG